MAEDQVKYSELVINDNNNFQSLIDALKKVKEKLAELKAEASNLSSSLRSVGTATKQQQQSTAEGAAAAERLSRDIKTLTDEEARLKVAISEANRMQKLQAQANSAAAGSLNEMRAKYKLLVAEIGNYNLKSVEGQRKMKATAAEARRLRDEIYKLESAYGQFGRNVGNYSGALSRFGARLKEAAVRFVAFNAAFLSPKGLIHFVKTLIEVRKELESTLVTYKALAGEIQGAKLFEEVKNFALTTPVTLNAASKAVQTMLSFGVAQEKVVDIMKRLGDISSADSERMQRLALAYSQATQAGRLMGQDTLQFINAGFNPLYYISLRTGKSMEYLRDQMKKGKINIQQVTQAIIDATSEGGQFNGMLEKQRETMKGAAAIMEGAWQNMLNEMGSDTENGIVGIIKWLTKLMQNWRETIRTMRQIAVSIGTAKVALLILEKTMWKVAASTEAATKATNKFESALKKNLVFFAISLFTKLVQKLIDTNREMNRLKDYSKEFADVEAEMNKEMKKEISRLDQLFAELRKAKKGTAEYKAARQAIIDGFGKYDETLGKELSDVNNLETAYQNLKIAIENSYKARARESFMDASNQRLSKAAVNIESMRNNILAESTDENGRWKPKALRRRNMRVPGGTTIPIPSDKEVFDALEQLLNARDIESLRKNRLYQMMGLGYNIDHDVRNYIQSLRAWIEAQNKADAMWGKYKPGTEGGYTPANTGGGGDNKNKKRAIGSFNDSYRGVTMADVMLAEANAMQDQGENALQTIELWYAKKSAIAMASYEKDMETLNEEEKRKEKSLTESVLDANVFVSKYNETVAKLDAQHAAGALTDDEWNAQKKRLKHQYDEANSLVGREAEERERLEKYYAEKRKVAMQKRDNELSDLEKQAQEKRDKENATTRIKGLNQSWQEERARLVERGAKRKELIDAEIAAEVNRLNAMLALERSVDGEKMTPEEKAKIEEWIKLLERMRAAGDFGDMKPGQIYGKGAANLSNEKKNYSSIWEVLQIDIDQNQISALNSVFDQAKAALSGWMDARKAAADQARELADDEVSAAENALNREIELRNQGYASDVALRERELADAKKRQEEALKMQQKAKEEELAMNTAMEASSIAVAIANLFKQFPLYAAIPLTALLLGTFTATKLQALSNIRSTKYREGGVMLLEGGSHESGHDVSLGIGPDGSNLRAEGGEYFAVINRRSSRRYGSEIPGIVNALNSGMFEEKYIKTADAVGMMPRVIRADDGSRIDLSGLEGGVSQLVRQGEKTVSVEGEWRVERYKNRVRRVRV